MAVVQILWEDENEKAVVEALRLDWLLYGQIHLTNARGLARLDPRGITYRPIIEGDARLMVVSLDRDPNPDLPWDNSVRTSD